MAGDGSGDYCNQCYGSEFGCIDCATKELREQVATLGRDLSALVMQRDELADKYKQAHDLLVSLGVW